jgi:hypothetical protein
MLACGRCCYKAIADFRAPSPVLAFIDTIDPADRFLLRDPPTITGKIRELGTFMVQDVKVFVHLPNQVMGMK